ncbi:hypothetical protein KUTeg_002570 [Tegillarca granosa]|uniref:Uncharacterized protein n=1 Tax=Tegillarca granosa TaxID=220873 RepID=A0ABQ9FZ65_TEGGR|nr:hypothetical protein KUTeg_002570 [Tegillarca granosa]
MPYNGYDINTLIWFKSSISGKAGYLSLCFLDIYIRKPSEFIQAFMQASVELQHTVANKTHCDVLIEIRMPTKGKYIAGKQVSRWDAESDNVDIEYKNLESHPKPSAFFDGRKGCALKILLLLVCFSVGLIFVYGRMRRYRYDVYDGLCEQTCFLNLYLNATSSTNDEDF